MHPLKLKLIKSNTSKIIETTVGRVLFNEFVPNELNYVNNF